MDEKKLSSGVQDLINRLREEGIAEGKKQSATLVEQARHEARTIVEEAENQAAAILDKAEQESRHIREAANDAVRLAARDTMLDLKGNLLNQFSRRVGAMVTEALRDEDILREIILEIAGRIRETVGDKDMEIVLPEDVIGLDELRKHPEKVREGSLGQFVLSLSKEILRDGVHVNCSRDQSCGLTIRLIDDEVLIELSDTVITEFLLKHLQPRFRALLEGSIQ